MKKIQVKNLGVVSFDSALGHQVKARSELKAGKGVPTIFVLEHEPTVITVGRHGNTGNIITGEEFLQKNGVQVRHISRGGDVTVHEKGQLVIYFVLPFPSKAVARLVQVLLETVREFIFRKYQINLTVDPKRPGLWYNRSKVSAVGIDATSGVTMHGISVNIKNNLFGFSLIKPCGMDAEITTLERITGEDIDMEQLRDEAVYFLNTEGRKRIGGLLDGIAAGR